MPGVNEILYLGHKRIWRQCTHVCAIFNDQRFLSQLCLESKIERKANDLSWGLCRRGIHQCSSSQALENLRLRSGLLEKSHDNRQNISVINATPKPTTRCHQPVLQSHLESEKMAHALQEHHEPIQSTHQLALQQSHARHCDQVGAMALAPHRKEHGTFLQRQLRVLRKKEVKKTCVRIRAIHLLQFCTILCAPQNPIDKPVGQHVAWVV